MLTKPVAVAMTRGFVWKKVEVVLPCVHGVRQGGGVVVARNLRTKTETIFC